MATVAMKTSVMATIVIETVVIGNGCYGQQSSMMHFFNNDFFIRESLKIDIKN